MSRIIRLAVCIAAATGLAAGNPGESFAQGFTNAIATGDWSAPGTWSGGVPTDSLPAAIDGGHTVTIASTSELTNLVDVGTASGQTGTLNVTGGELTIFDTNTVAAPNLPSIRIGQAAGSTGNFKLSGGLVTIAGNVGSGFADGELIVGDVGNGTMTQTGGTLAASDEIVIGLAEGATGVVNVSGGDFKADGRSILVGFDGNGTLNVSGTGNVRANFDMLVGFLEGGVGTVNLTGGTIEAGFLFTNSFTGPAGSTAVMTQTGGTFNARIAYVLGQSAGTTTMTHSGGAINAPTNNGDMVVSDGNGNTTTYNISGTATVNLLHNFIVGAFGGSNGTVNQTGGTITAGDNLLIGHDGNGVWNMNGGTNNAANVFLGNFDSSNGTLKISSGTLNLTGNLNVGGALASNAAPDRVEPDGANGAQGQALDANGTLIVSGSAATIDVAGNFLANPDDKSAFRSDPFIAGADNSATLGFEIFNATGTSLIDVVGIADLDGAVIDLDLMGGFTPTAGATFDLLTASSFGSTGVGTTQNVGTGEAFTLASEDAGVFSLALVPGGRGEILRATFLAAPGNDADFDNDGDVDGADFLTWQRGLGLSGATATNAAGNANGDSIINGADLAVWRSEFGPPSVPAVGAVPEPGAAALLLIAAAGFAASRTATRSGRRLA
jgi:T5SS/PEP-CTERM-associated repeat protein